MTKDIERKKRIQNAHADLIFADQFNTDRWYLGGYITATSNQSDWRPPFDLLPVCCKDAWEMGWEDGRGDIVDSNP
jgi:hypothetical protein